MECLSFAVRKKRFRKKHTGHLHLTRKSFSYRPAPSPWVYTFIPVSRQNPGCRSLRKGDTFFHLILTTLRGKNLKRHFTKDQRKYANWLRSHSKLIGWDLGFSSIILATSCFHLFIQQISMNSNSPRSWRCSRKQGKLFGWSLPSCVSV